MTDTTSTLIDWIDAKVKEHHGRIYNDKGIVEQFENGKFWAFKEMQERLKSSEIRGDSQLAKDIYTEVFDNYHRVGFQGESLNFRAQQATDAILKHVAYHAPKREIGKQE